MRNYFDPSGIIILCANLKIIMLTVFMKGESPGVQPSLKPSKRVETTVF